VIGHARIGYDNACYGQPLRDSLYGRARTEVAVSGIAQRGKFKQSTLAIREDPHLLKSLSIYEPSVPRKARHAEPEVHSHYQSE
jgi:hypothetical protein